MNAEVCSFLIGLSDAELLAETIRLAQRERAATASLVSAIAEVDARRLYLPQGYSSLFTYCTLALHLSEQGAYRRIEAARLTRRFPDILAMLQDGELTLATVCLLAPHLTSENARRLLEGARHQSKREVEHLVATLRPQPAVPAVVRKLPTPVRPSPSVDGSADLLAPPVADESAALAALTPPPRRAVVVPLAPGRYKLQVTLSTKGHDALRRLQQLMRHTIPKGDPAEIVERALIQMVERVEKTKFAEARRPRRAASKPVVRSRHIPAHVKRKVWRRDGGQCAFVGTAGRCSERAFLEFHHVVAYVDGGEATAENIQLRCRAHNQHEFQQFGLT